MICERQKVIYLNQSSICRLALCWLQADKLQHLLQVLQLIFEQVQKLVELQLTRLVSVVLREQLMKLLGPRERLPNPAQSAPHQGARNQAVPEHLLATDVTGRLECI